MMKHLIHHEVIHVPLGTTLRMKIKESLNKSSVMSSNIEKQKERQGQEERD